MKIYIVYKTPNLVLIKCIIKFKKRNVLYCRYLELAELWKQVIHISSWYTNTTNSTPRRA